MVVDQNFASFDRTPTEQRAHCDSAATPDGVALIKLRRFPLWRRDSRLGLAFGSIA
jgi:hypothetical protein